MRKFACFTPLIVFATAVLFISSFAVAKATVVKKATQGQCVIQNEVAVTVPAPAVAPDIAVVPSVKNSLVVIEEEAIPATKNAEVARVSSSLKSSLQKTATATSSLAVVQDFECAITHEVAAAFPDIGVVTHQTVTSVVRT